MTDGSVYAVLPGHIDSLEFAKKPHDKLFWIEYRNGKTELWELADVPRRLVDLERGLQNRIFRGGNILIDPTGRCLVVHYRSGEVYLLDLAFLRALADAGEALTRELLIELVCTGPFASGLLNEAAVQQAMGTLKPKVCGASSMVAPITALP